MEAMLLRPAYKDYLWGGTRLKSDYGKKTDMMPLAESWQRNTDTPPGGNLGVFGTP